MKLRSYSFVSTLALIRLKRDWAIEAEMWMDAAHWRNCEIALERMAEGFSGGWQRWGVPICIDPIEA